MASFSLNTFAVKHLRPPISTAPTRLLSPPLSMTSSLKPLNPLTQLISRQRSALTVRAITDDDEWGPEPAASLPEGSKAKAALPETSTATEEKGDDVAPEEDGGNVAELKAKLKEALYGTERGRKASSETRGEVVEIITQLEARNPNPAPNEALQLLNGKWILAYTSFSQLLPLLRSSSPLVRVDEISQTIDAEAFTVQNSIKFAGPLATTSLSTNAKFEVRSPKRVQIKFDEGIIGTPQLTDSIVLPDKIEFLGQKIDLSPFRGVFNSIQNTASSVARTISNRPTLKFPISNRLAQSWLLTTYLDEELRICRGDGSSVFVLVKEGSSLLNY